MVNFLRIIFQLCFCLFMNRSGLTLRSRSALIEERSYHRPNHLHGENLDSIASQVENLAVFKRALQNILVPRVVGSESHKKVQNCHNGHHPTNLFLLLISKVLLKSLIMYYIINELSSLGWSIELDAFTAKTPIGNLPFKNIIATHNPTARRFLDFACHYDSKYYPGNNNFVGATDSAVPCAIMIHIAHALNDSLEKNKRQDISLRFIFFDGEEAFRSWSKTDSLYGARHLAKKWHNIPYPEGGPGATQLDRIDMLVLLDLLGARNPEFYSFFPETQVFYKILANAETKLSQRHLLRGYSRRYFHKKSTDAHIEDDHLPFLERDVPIVHVITVPFPPEWHTADDNRKIVDFQTTQNLIKIMSVFIAEYMNIPV